MRICYFPGHIVVHGISIIFKRIKYRLRRLRIYSRPFFMANQTVEDVLGDSGLIPILCKETISNHETRYYYHSIFAILFLPASQAILPCGVNRMV